MFFVGIASLAGCDGGGGDDGGGDGTTVGLTFVRSTVLGTSAIDASGAGVTVAADMDGDGEIDAASAFESSDAIVLHMQTSAGRFTNSTIASGHGSVRAIADANFDSTPQRDLVAAGAEGELTLWLSPAFSGSTSPMWDASVFTNPADITTWADVATGDIDGSGNVDVIAVSDDDAQLVYFRAAGTIDSAADFTAYVIAETNGQAFRRLSLADVDGDGDTDIVAVGSEPGAGLAWFENPGGGSATGTWTQRQISSRVGMSRVQAIDLDDDGDVDVLTADPATMSVRWFECTGSARAGNWSEHVLATRTSAPTSVWACDLQGDGAMDVLIGTTSEIGWARAASSPVQTWSYATIGAISGEVGVFVADDIDGEGKTDFITTLAGSTTPVVFYDQK